jgi:hypothetical protein
MLIEKRCGSVYLVSAEEEYYKIGIAFDVTKRLRILQASCPLELELVHSFDVACLKRAYGKHFCLLRVQEADLHRHFNAKRTHGEWFLLDKTDIEYIRSFSAKRSY